MVAVIMLSLVVTGVATIVYFKNQNDEYHEKRLSRQEARVISTIEYYLKDSQLDANLDTYIKDFEDKILEIADVNNLKINIFNNQGDILMSSEVDLDNPDFFKQKIPSDIYQDILSNEHVVIQKEKDDTKFLSTYSYLKDDLNRKICIINLPYSRSNAANKREVREFLYSLLVIYGVLLVGTAILAYLLSNYITKSLRVIADKFKSIGINKKNERIEWESKDEIGSLVSEYNDMITQLESSADKLAKSERESAWREMAKQVAHEIKNPLTPMKLSVQHLERSYSPDDPDFKEKMAKFSERMIQQIDTLTSIANEFSNFAKMPKSSMSQINLIKVIKSSIEIFDNSENVNIDFQSELDTNDLIINGDDEQLTRVFNNLIKNSIQSIPKERKGEVKVIVSHAKESIKIEVSDNGEGITNEQKDKIFVPNFTTKTSGSGLGLAMVKNIVENHKGDIWFESDPPKGTSFFVTLPQN